MKLFPAVVFTSLLAFCATAAPAADPSNDMAAPIAPRGSPIEYIRRCGAGWLHYCEENRKDQCFRETRRGDGAIEYPCKGQTYVLHTNGNLMRGDERVARCKNLANTAWKCT